MPRDVLCFLLGQSKTPFAKADCGPSKNYTLVGTPANSGVATGLSRQTAVSVHDRFSLAGWQNCENQLTRSDTTRGLRLCNIREALILVRNFCPRNPKISDPARTANRKGFTITVRVVLAPHLGRPWLISLQFFCLEGQDKLGVLSRIIHRQSRDLRVYQGHSDRCPIGQTSANPMRPYWTLADYR